MAFSVGDIVQLKSGSPKMTVIDVTASRIQTSWFAGAKNERAYFHEKALEIASEDEKGSGTK